MFQITIKAKKTHFYYAMMNNDGTAAGFQQYLLNIVDHYKVMVYGQFLFQYAK